MHWRLRLKEYDYDMDYKKGKDNAVADALSRMYPVQIIEDIPIQLRIKTVVRPRSIEEILPDDLVNELDSPNTDSTETLVEDKNETHEQYIDWKIKSIPFQLKLEAIKSYWKQLFYYLLGKYHEKA